MSATSRRADRAEERAAKTLGTARIGGKQKRRSVADVAPVRLPDGRLMQPEIKSRLHLPRFLTRALEQAHRYSPTAHPLVILYERGRRGGLVCLDLALFLELVGLRQPDAAAQLSLALETRR
jgi:hypothetical protein